MRGIIYTSAALVPFDDSHLQDLAYRAAQRNLELGITGYLNFENNRFIQYIEGDFDPVTHLMGRILRDPRHQVRTTLYDDKLADRRFPNWRMRWLRRSEFVASEQVLANYLILMNSVSTANRAWEQSAW